MFVKEWIKNTKYLIYIIDKLREFYNKHLVSDEKLVSKKFKKNLGRELNLQNPVKYNDKLQWLKLYWYDSFAVKCADKYEVRDYVANTIGSKYLNNLIAIYESVEEINLDKLPKSFVLKGTHGSGFNIICKDKDHMDWKSQFKKMKRWLWTNYYWTNREWVYKDIKPRIICEEYIEEMHTGQLMDYKIFCFSGEPQLVEVDFDRFTNHKRNLYDLNWNFINAEIKHPSEPEADIRRPETLDEMLNLSRILSDNFPHVRVDFYSLNNRVIFGELTFFHESGMGKFSSSSFEIELGRYLKLPKSVERNSY